MAFDNITITSKVLPNKKVVYQKNQKAIQTDYYLPKFNKSIIIPHKNFAYDKIDKVSHYSGFIDETLVEPLR